MAAVPASDKSKPNEKPKYSLPDENNSQGPQGGTKNGLWRGKSSTMMDHQEEDIVRLGVEDLACARKLSRFYEETMR